VIEKLFELILVSPFIWMVFLAMIFFLRIKINERLLSESVRLFCLYMFFMTLMLFVTTLIHSPSFLLLDLEDWIHVGDYHFKIRFIVDLLGATYAVLTTSLIGIIIKFSRNYLHKEEGYFRFIFLLSTLMFGLLIVSFARSLDLLFVGWELVGTASVLLISYFHDKPRPVSHAIKAMVTYRICDMGILAAAAWSHLHFHSTDFVIFPKMLHADPHSFGPVIVGFFVLWASLGKAGQLPMSSWLPAAMEGPTPSSAIFYGALSVHLGPFLLLRFYDYFSHFPSLLVAVGMIGAASAFYATLVGRTRSDAKTMLAFATISQVGIIYVEIAMGFQNLALFHMVTHASLRTYQFLRSNSLIQDFVENPMVEHHKYIRRGFFFEKFFSQSFREKLFVHALHGFHLDFFTKKIIDAFLFPMKCLIKIEERLMIFDTYLLKLILRKTK